MKSWKRLQMGLLTGCMLALLCGQTAAAETGGNAQDYSYTVTFYAGNQGSFNSSAVQTQSASAQVSAPENEGGEIRVTGLKQGDRVTLEAQSGVVDVKENEKYYVRGIRESGRDNNTVGSSTFTVEGDREYVVAYGIRGDMVAYVVNYQDAAGNALAESQTFYGVAGDQPVVAFRYVENYQPQAYNLTKTLSSNEAENVFTFVYQELTAGAAGPAGTAGTTEAAGTAATPGAAGAADTAGGTGAGGAGAGAGTEGGAGAAGGTGEGGAAETAEPEELVNLDDEETPLANVDDKDGKAATKRSAGNMPLFIGIAAAAVLVLAAFIVLVWKKKLKR